MQASKPNRQQQEQKPGKLNYPFSAPQSATVDNLSITEVAAGLFWLRMPMPLALDHINVYLLKDADGWYIVDTGLSTEQSKAIWHQVNQHIFAGVPLKGVVCTHYHYDHASLAGWLGETFNAPLYMTQSEYLMARAMAGSQSEAETHHREHFFMRCGMPAEKISSMLNACRNDPYMSIYPKHYIRILEGDQLQIGGRQWQVMTGSGHSPEHACLFSAEDQILLAGDQLLPEISSNILVADFEPNANPLKAWLASLERLKSLPENTLVLPSHGSVFQNIHTRIEQLIQHHISLLDQLKKLAGDEGQFTAYQAMKYLFPRPLKPIEYMLAQGEALAHLNWLKDAGCLEHQSHATDPSAPDIYRLPAN